jgi:eukaryotic-like serine/threonine-protein kinase
VQTNCPQCGFEFDASGGRPGLKAVCPRCKGAFDAFSVGETIEIDRNSGEVRKTGPHAPVGSEIGKQFQEYRLVEEIGRGAMGVVYKAIQETLDRPVALKMIITGEAAREEEIKRFMAEAAAVARLRHPNVVNIHELDVHEGTYYYTMDYIEGRDLGALIGKEGMEQRQAAILALKVARALAHTHSKHIIHRDLKPGNIIVDEMGEPVLTDFGLACDVRATEDGNLEAAGTPEYMAPEQVQGRLDRVGPGTDIYSLGALLYEMLVGRPPFQAGSIEELFGKITSEEPEPLSQLKLGLSPGLCAIVTRCLHKAPADRYGSAGEMAEALGAWLRGSD